MTTEPPPLPPYVYGRECGENERVLPLAQVEAYAAAAVAAALEQQAAEIERLRAALHRVRSVMGPTVPACCGCATEWRMALEAIDAAMKKEST